MATSLDKGIRRNREAPSRFLSLADRLSPAEWNQPVAPGKWSPAQIAEHLALTYEISSQALQGTSSLPALPAPVRPFLRWMVLLSIKKGQFPPRGRATKGMIPSATAIDREKVLPRLTMAVDTYTAECTAAEKAGREAFVHPAFGRIRVVDYLLFNDLHTRHRTSQIPAPTSY
jgi:hypothetical protein